MHDFLRAVGFKNIKDQKELDELLQSIVSSQTNYMSAELLHMNRQKYKSMQKKNLMPESVMRFV